MVKFFVSDSIPLDLEDRGGAADFVGDDQQWLVIRAVVGVNEDYSLGPEVFRRRKIERVGVVTNIGTNEASNASR